MRRLTTLRLVLALLGAGCSTPSAAVDAGPRAAPPPTPPSAVAVATPSPPPPPTPARPAVAPPRAGEVVSIPAGALRAGSRPGLPGRRPSVEADLAPIELDGFDIDRLPYPNDPARPPTLAATRREAQALCEAEGRRLCDELEWERACRGDGEASFATGEELDVAACLEDVTACASPDGVLDLGVRAPEWTASDAPPRLAVLERTAVARGGRPEDSPAAHRCGTRHAVNPAGGGRALAFRCCGGARSEASYPDVGLRRQFRELDVPPDRWRAIFASIEPLARFAEGFEVAGESAGVQALARGGATVEEMHWELATAPFAWSPSVGEEVWIVSGRTADAALLVALYPMGGDRFLHAASFVVEEPETSFAILRDPATRGELLWSTCWSCGGENGAIRFTDDATIVIVQQ